MQIYDLLSPLKDGKPLRALILADTLVMRDLIEIPVGSVEAVLAVMTRGNLNRSVGATAANARSSRSHAVFQAKVRPLVGARQH